MTGIQATEISTITVLLVAGQPSSPPSVFAICAQANLAMPAGFHSSEQCFIHSLCLDTVWENLTKTRWGTL